jgi:shikimate dehydrogenase
MVDGGIESPAIDHSRFCVIIRGMDSLEAKAFLFAHPAKHSLSPAMHNAALEQMSIAAKYEARDIAPEDLKAALEALRHSSAWGANLSIPHKEAALEFLDEISEEARVIGAVNTVVVRDGRLLGMNTDAPGFMRSLIEAGIRVQGHRVVVLGAGGAARGVAWALKSAGANVMIWNRTSTRAKALAQELGLDSCDEVSLETAIKEGDGLVNTTSVGLEDASTSPLPNTDWLPQHWVCDIVYRPLETKLLRDARAHGLLGVDGLGMLVHQGAMALEAWTGRAVDAGVMRAAAFEALGLTKSGG